MQIHHVGYRIRGFSRLAQFGHRGEMTPQDAQHRLQILQFFARHGPAATCEAFGISRRTLYRWKQTVTQAGGNPAALAARSSAPCRRRQSTWSHALIQEIRRLRTTFPNLGKVKLHVLLRPWCGQHGLALPSVSTIGRLIARDPQKMRHAPLRLDALCRLLPAPPRYVLSDNGSEFLGHFQQRLEEHGITHWWTYPRSPKMNAHVERFNRTIQEQFVDYHEDVLFDDLAAFNRKLAEWLLAYNTVLPHHSLGRQSPVQFLLQHQPECQRWWTYTRA